MVPILTKLFAEFKARICVSPAAAGAVYSARVDARAVSG
jgi:hypothetical protein